MPTDREDRETLFSIGQDGLCRIWSTDPIWIRKIEKIAKRCSTPTISGKQGGTWLETQIPTDRLSFSVRRSRKSRLEGESLEVARARMRLMHENRRKARDAQAETPA
jgi:hypothetical protein